MKTILIISCLIITSFFTWSQSDTILLSSNKQLFTVNEAGSKLSFDTMQNQGFNVFVDTNSLSYMEYYSSSFPYSYEEYSSKIKGHKTIQTYDMYIFYDEQHGQITKLKIQDGSLVMIQEAKDSVGNWNPIEYFNYSGCGNSYTHKNILPGTHLKSKIAIYSGDFRTSLRVKILINNTVQYSNEFYGSINNKQFIEADSDYPFKFK